MKSSVRNYLIGSFVGSFAFGAFGGEVVFEKAISQNRRVEMIRTSISYKPPSREEEETLKAKSPKAGFVRPDAVYEYSLRLNEGANSVPRTLWKTEFKFYDWGPAIPSDFRVLDISSIRTNQLLLLVKAGASTGCHLVSTATNADPATQQPGQHLYGDNAALGKVVVTGHYFATNSTEGTIELELAIKEKVKWHLKGQQFEQEVLEAPPKNVPFPPLPPKIE